MNPTQLFAPLPPPEAQFKGLFEHSDGTPVVQEVLVVIPPEQIDPAIFNVVPMNGHLFARPVEGLFNFDQKKK